MLHIKIKRNDSKVNFKASNGDKYDASLTILSFINTAILRLENVNADSTINYKGGKLASGTYYAIEGMHKGKYKCLKLFQATQEELAKIKSIYDVTPKMRTLPSSIPNPNNNNEYIIKYVNIHLGGTSWDFSHGCCTLLPSDYEKLMACVKGQGIVEIELID